MSILKTLYSRLIFLHPVWRRCKYFFDLTLVQLRLNKSAIKVRNSCSKIKICFLVAFDSNFPLQRVFDLMLSDVDFAPYIIIIPVVNQGDEYRDETYNRTLNTLREKYSDRVLDIRDGENYRNISGRYDLYFPINPYSALTHINYQIPYLARHGNLVAAVRYFTDTGTIYSDVFNALPELGYLWRFYAESPMDMASVAKKQFFLKNFSRIVAVGRPKMDDFTNSETVRTYKRIVIAPHHSLDPQQGTSFSISNFPRYAKLFLELPILYPRIQWVFRPHPLTMVTMVRSGRWTQKECDAYIEKMSSYENVEYQAGGSYLDTFANSDGIIQDCSSFLPEYFFTKKPQCYLLKNTAAEGEQFLAFGKKLLSYTYKAYSESDIIHFIDKVVLGGDDPLFEKREEFTKKELMYNYPRASESLIADLKKSFGRGK